MAATYTVKQVAQILGYSTNSIYTFLKEKRIKGVRVGRGRFRVPQSELDRLLLTKKSKSPAEVGVVTAALEAPLAMTPGAPQVLQTPQKAAPSGVETRSVFDFDVLASPRVDVPSLFDWFVGLSSVILGLTMFLFSRVYEEFAIERFAVALPGVRMAFIAGGFGLLLADVVGKRSAVWRRIFKVVLVLAYGTYSAILAAIGDWEAAVIFGAAGAMMVVSRVARIRGIDTFVLYVISVVLLMPAVILVAPAASTLTGYLAVIPLPVSSLVYLWFAAVFACTLLVWAGYAHHRGYVWVCMVAMSVLLIGLSLHFAQRIAWGRSLYVLLAGLIALFVPVWDSLLFVHKRDRRLVFSVFGALLLFFVTVVGVIRILQTNLLDYARQQLANQVSYGKTLIESTIASGKTTIEGAAQNPVLADAMDKGDAELLSGFLRGVFEGNKNFRRVFTLSAKGEFQTIYPLDTVVSGKSFSFQDYFTKPVATKGLYVSDVFQSIDEASQPSMVIAMPVFTKKGKEKELAGVLVGALDLDSLGNKLQKIAVTTLGEYFVVIDRNAKRIIHPERETIGTEIEEHDLMRDGLEGKSGIGEAFGTKDVRTLISFDTVSEDTNWVIGVKEPITGVLASTNAAAVAIVSVLLISVCIISVFLVLQRMRTPAHHALGDEPLGEMVEKTVAGVLHEAVKKKRKLPVPKKDTS